MTLNRNKVAMIVLVGLLCLAAPVPPQHAGAQAPAADKVLNDASAAHDRAAKAYNDLMAKMNSAKGMPNMDENEKTLVMTMQQMADTLKTLLDANKATLDALKELKPVQK